MFVLMVGFSNFNSSMIKKKKRRKNKRRKNLIYF